MTKNNAENNGLFLWCKFGAKYSFFNARETFHEYIYIYKDAGKTKWSVRRLVSVRALFTAL